MPNSRVSSFSVEASGNGQRLKAVFAHSCPWRADQYCLPRRKANVRFSCQNLIEALPDITPVPLAIPAHSLAIGKAMRFLLEILS